MKAAVITRHAVNNYGSLLQAIATQAIIEQNGFDCEIIDYVRRDESIWEKEKTELLRKTQWNKHWLRKWVYLILRQPQSIIVGKIFEKYQRKYLNLSKRFSSKGDLIKDKPAADCYITGSDQVWGMVANGVYDDCYCLSFTGEGDKCFSLSSSFGRTEFAADTVDYYKERLKVYTQILVREESAVQKLAEWGFKAQKVLDPTLLINTKHWEKYIKHIKIKKKYILIYQLHNNPRLDNYAKELAKKRGLKLVRVSPSLHQMNRGGRLIWCPSPEHFLTLIKNAECLITDSFHGTAFAIAFNTPFIEVLPNNNTETRNLDLLSMCGLTERILGIKDDYALYDKPIDFRNVNFIMERERKGSMDILRGMLQSVK